MSVEKVMRDPEWVEISETSDEPGPTRGGLCLVCGEWIEAGAGDAYRVVVSRNPRRAEYACHEACLERVAHPSIPLPS